MRTLLHLPFDPACRMVRIALAEKGLPASFVTTPPWDDDGKLAAINPAGGVPVLLDEPPTGGDIAVCPAGPIIEYLDDAYPSTPLFPSTSAGKAEVRRLLAWFSEKFDPEAGGVLIFEKIEKRIRRLGLADYEVVKAGVDALNWHLDYFEWLCDQRSWFGGERFSAADIAAAARLSSLDYVDAISWNKFENLKAWYAKIKSRPSMRPILRDRIEGVPPPRHYDDLDF